MIDVFSIYDTTPFGLSLSKPFDKLRANGRKLPVMSDASLNSYAFDSYLRPCSKGYRHKKRMNFVRACFSDAAGFRKVARVLPHGKVRFPYDRGWRQTHRPHRCERRNLGPQRCTLCRLVKKPMSSVTSPR